jgi:hypothetical protein
MAKIRKSFSHDRTRQAVMEREANRKRGLKPTTSPAQKRMTPEEEQAFLAAFKQRQAETDAYINAYINSPEFAEKCRKDEEKHKRTEERRVAREAKRQAEREERRQNPKSPIDAYWNYKESCFLLDTKEHRTWKKANPTFEFNGVTYRAHWIPQLTNSGKNTRWMGYLTGSDGSSIVIKGRSH